MPAKLLDVGWDRLCKWLVVALGLRVFGADLLTGVRAMLGG